jgi:mannose-6-phosphate isomerase-like protein (cupin superfamily)
MYVVNLNEFPVMTFGIEAMPETWMQGGFPFSAATGNKNTAVVYIVIEPGHRLESHTDSAEEILLFLAGEAEVTVGAEQGQVSAGAMALVPSMVPHSIRNVGKETLRAVGFFSSNTVMSTFEQSMVPIGVTPMSPLGTRTVLIPMPVLLEQSAEPVAEAVA